jgi:hypothetical protein
MITDVTAPDSEGRLLGIPYEFRMPTTARFKARHWHPDDVEAVDR